MTTFDIRICEESDGTTIELHGEFDLAATEPLARAIAQACATAKETLTLDLAQTTYIDSSCLHVVAGGAERCIQNRVKLRVVGATGVVRRVFEITGLDELLTDE